MLPEHGRVVPENPNVLVVWHFEDDPFANINKFQPFFYSFDASIEGFQSCRSVTNIGGTHLLRKYRGTMSVAVRVNINDQFSCLHLSLWKARTTIVGIGSWLVFEPRWHKDPICAWCHTYIKGWLGLWYLGWGQRWAHHRCYVHHLVNKFHSKFHDESLKIVLVGAAYEQHPCKFD